MGPRPRTELGTILKNIMGDGYSIATYYQPPSNTRIQYPCILYEHSSSDTDFANDRPYMFKKRYLITIIDRDPDSIIPDKIAEIPQCLPDRHFVSDNLHHWTFYIYF